MKSALRRKQVYEHRLVQLVQQLGDSAIATRLGVPRTPVAEWLARRRFADGTCVRLDGSAAYFAGRTISVGFDPSVWTSA